MSSDLRGSDPRTVEPDTLAADRRPTQLVIVGGGALLAIGFVWVLLVGSYAQYAATLIVGALVVLTIPIARHAARIEQWPALTGLMMGSMLARLGGAVARYAVAYGAYNGIADASTYTQVATTHYKAFRSLHLFVPTTGVFHGLIPWIDTVIYSFFGPTEIGAFFVFSWFNFIGTYLFYRAFRIAYPSGDRNRYAILLFFLPSLVYWPSSLGKESWMMFAIGLACYGLARALASKPGGYMGLMAGVGAMLLVRPHLGLIFMPAAFFAFVFRRSRQGRNFRLLGRIIGIGVLVVSSLVVVAKAQSFFGIKTLDAQTISQELKTTRQQTDLGNSAFTPPNAQSPIGYPEAVATVLFRPFPFEAHSLTVLVASLEGVFLMGITYRSRRRLRRIVSALRESPYILFCVVYVALFIFAFSNFSNFGILARERVQMLPMFLALLAIPLLRNDTAEPAVMAASIGLGRRGLGVTRSRRQATTRPPLPTYTGRRGKGLS